MQQFDHYYYYSESTVVTRVRENRNIFVISSGTQLVINNFHLLESILIFAALAEIAHEEYQQAYLHESFPPPAERSGFPCIVIINIYYFGKCSYPLGHGAVCVCKRMHTYQGL